MASQYSLKGQVLPEMMYLIWLIVLSNVTLGMQSNDVNCIVYNEEFMECTWSHSEGKPNYTLYHWYYSKPGKECGNYIQQDGYNVGCNFSYNEVSQFQDFHVYINGSTESGNLTSHVQTFQLQNQVKPNPPGNLAVNVTTKNELFLSWDAPMKLSRCLMYGVRYRSNKDTEWQKATVNVQMFNLASVDPEKLYTFQVQSKINDYCGTTNLWSEWSLHVQWGRNETQIGNKMNTTCWCTNNGNKNQEGCKTGCQFAITRFTLSQKVKITPGEKAADVNENSKEGLHTIITVISLLGLIVLVFTLMRSERLKVIIIPKIPNPGRSFDPLFDNHNGNFQDWLGVPKDTLEGFKSIYHENVCIVSESPSDSTENGDHEGSYEQLGRTAIIGKESTPDNKGEIQPKNTSPATLFSDIAVFVESSRYAINENIYVRV